jgi:hypothetical protein
MNIHEIGNRVNALSIDVTKLQAYTNELEKRGDASEQIYNLEINRIGKVIDNLSLRIKKLERKICEGGVCR